MLYELRAFIYVENAHDLADVRDKLRDLVPKMKVINPCTEAQECSTIDLIENHHDESPHEPCHILQHWDNCPVCS